MAMQGCLWALTNVILACSHPLLPLCRWVQAGQGGGGGCCSAGAAAAAATRGAEPAGEAGALPPQGCAAHGLAALGRAHAGRAGAGAAGSTCSSLSLLTEALFLHPLLSLLGPRHKREPFLWPLCPA